MFVRKLRVEFLDTATGETGPCPLRWIDNFAMRNFTNDAIFDDTLPLTDGLLEAGYRVPLPALRDRMEEWFRRKGYLSPTQSVQITELPGPAQQTSQASL